MGALYRVFGAGQLSAGYRYTAQEAQLRLSRFKLARPPTPRDTEVSNAYAIIHHSLGPVCMCSLIGINSPVQATVLALTEKRVKIEADDDGDIVVRYVPRESLQRQG